jgi:hypothetical protein
LPRLLNKEEAFRVLKRTLNFHPTKLEFAKRDVPAPKESLLHSLANQFSGDLAPTDSTRVLRLPDFANRKLTDEFIVQARQETDAVYTARDFRIHEDALEPPRNLGQGQERLRTVPSGHKSQSENDWAFAKRALARGDDPEVVIQRIADYRADKDNPNYYARHTVMKAQAELQSKPFKLPAPQPPDIAGNDFEHDV